MTRRVTIRRATLTALAALVLLPLVACVEGDGWQVAADRSEAGVGDEVAVLATLTTSQPGCPFLVGGRITNPRDRVTFEVEPEGARVSADGTFVADEPGTYKVYVWDSGARTGTGMLEQRIVGSVTIAVSEDGSATVTGSDEGPSPLVGKWEFPEKGINTDTGEYTETRWVAIAQAADGSLKATWDYGGTAVPTYDPKTGEVVIDAGFKTDFSHVYRGTLSGDTIAGQVDYAGSASGGKMDTIVQGELIMYDFNQPWSAKRVE